MMSKIIPFFPVVTDGLVNSVCSVYASLPEMLGRKIQNFINNSEQPLFFSDYIRAARMGEQEAILKDTQPKCIIASSGMLTGGASVTYARGLCNEAKHAIFLSGYQDAESPGRRLQELQSGDTLEFSDATSAVVKCRVERFHLSAHSDQGQLVSFIKTINPKTLALVHGEKNALGELREKLCSKYPVTCPFNRQVLSVTEAPEWVSPAAITKLQKKKTLNVDVKMTDTCIEVDTDVTSERWQEIVKGAHTATLKGNRLIIRKV